MPSPFSLGTSWKYWDEFERGWSESVFFVCLFCSWQCIQHIFIRLLIAKFIIGIVKDGEQYEYSSVVFCHLVIRSTQFWNICYLPGACLSIRDSVTKPNQVPVLRELVVYWGKWTITWILAYPSYRMLWYGFYILCIFNCIKTKGSSKYNT